MRAAPALPANGRGQAWQTFSVTAIDEGARRALVRRGFALEWATLGWNVACGFRELGYRS
jgi:hypothetical protein